MKTKIFIFVSLLALVSAALFFSCDNPIGLGNHLDILGPIVEFSSPVARKAVGPRFTIEGTVSDATGIDRLLLKTENNNVSYPKQWRYSNGKWEVSQNKGASWQPLSGAKWDGTEKKAKWSIPIDLDINGNVLKDGEYLFILQAWDKGGFTDADSYKTRILIIDSDPPKVDVSNPFLYRYETWDDVLGEFTGSSGLQALHGIGDNDDDRFEPSLIGKFYTQPFQLQWQIEDEFDVWSIDLRFFEHDVEIDNAAETVLPNNYIYRYFKNDLEPPVIPQPQNNIKPNGNVTIPALNGPSVIGFYEGGTWELKTPIAKKTTIKVVAACYDAAGHPSQEKTLGYFVYWPKADEPWITYADGMEDFDTYVGPGGAPINGTFGNVYMIYPGRRIRATAFHAHGLKEVKFSLYDVVLTIQEGTGVITNLVVENTPRQDRDKSGNLIYDNIAISNTVRPNGSYSTIFPWEFTPPPKSGYFVVRAKAYSNNSGSAFEESAVYEALFRVQDISFPNFPEEPKPLAGNHLYRYIDNGKITITGKVSDATDIVSLTMVWINSQSRNYSAMSQLQYFRDQDYQGWEAAKTLTITGSNTSATNTENNVGTPTAPGIDPPYPYDTNNPNRLWNIKLSPPTLDVETNRQVFNYSITIDLLNDLNIGINQNQQPLSSQVFLLRAENPDKKTEIITYAPQGDTISPKVGITNVQVTSGGNTKTYTPNNNTSVIDQFISGDIITVNGTWEEDSAEYLDINSYFKPNMNVTVNGYSIPQNNITLTADGNSGLAKTTGTWKAVVTVTAAGGIFPVENLRDTLVVSALVKDFGGNNAETGNSWLIQTEYLRLMRISSVKTDGTYTNPEVIEFFLEFNKAVQLAENRAGNPRLKLNSNTEAVAEYIPNSFQSTRQFFRYIVSSGDSTKDLNEKYLNVTGINNTTSWSAGDYPLTWERGLPGTDAYEQIRVTMESGHTGQEFNSGAYRAIKLPTTTTTSVLPEYQSTLVAGKNIEIDTSPPTVETITRAAAGDYAASGEIYITVEFNKPVAITGTPRLTLQITNGGNNSVQTDTSNIRVNGEFITFVYTVQNGDTTNGSQVVVTGHSTTSGTIKDLAGNALASNGVSSKSSTIRTLTGVYVDTIKPAPPTINILASSNTGSTPLGTSGSSDVNIGNLYNDELYLYITPIVTSPANYDNALLEYKVGAAGDWTRVINNPVSISLQGQNTIVARQTDRAGNVSDSSKALIFNWDKGNLVTRISSSSANGTYTHVNGRNSIPITIYFRKNVNISTTAGIRINAIRGAGSGTQITLTTPNVALPVTGVNSLTFNYIVTDGPSNTGDRMPAGVNWLDVVGIIGITATDTTGVNVSSYFSLPAAGNALRLGENKEIRVETGALTNTAPVFNAASAGFPAGSTAGIKDDGSYWTTLEIPFNHSISKGSGNITIKQIQGSGATAYRLPAVLTESQYDRFRSIAGFDTYYTKGTNGYNYTSASVQGANTTAKYVMNYQYNPNRSVIDDNSAFTGDRHIPTEFFDDFREEEKIIINVNAQIVEVSGSVLKVRLTGSSAPQVPGASYAVTYSGGLVVDSLGNDSAPGNYTGEPGDQPAITLGGIAKPFVRIKKDQDTISINDTINGNTPRLTAVQPQYAYVRMDCRTPDTSIQYGAKEITYAVTGVNWSLASGPNTTNTTVTPNATTPPTILATPPNPNTVTGGTNPANLQIGNNTIQGYRWWVRAKAVKGAVESDISDEMAYRTAITYVTVGMADTADTVAHTRLTDGDQIWIRGGDAISSSTIPGFPFTWGDDFTSLLNSKKRAGIRLMTKTNNTDALNSSTWNLLTWEMNATAYIDIIRGKEEAETVGGVSFTTSSVQQAWQYGPRRWSNQRGGWTFEKLKYPINPGEYRWLSTGVELGSSGAINFISAFTSRGNLTVTHPAPNQK